MFINWNVHCISASTFSHLIKIFQKSHSPWFWWWFLHFFYPGFCFGLFFLINEDFSSFFQKLQSLDRLKRIGIPLIFIVWSGKSKYITIFKALDSKKSYIFHKLSFGTPQVGFTPVWNFLTKENKCLPFSGILPPFIPLQANLSKSAET